MLLFIYSEKPKRFCEISTVDLTGTTEDKSMVDILQNFVAFSEYMKFTRKKIMKTSESMRCRRKAHNSRKMGTREKKRDRGRVP